jgi:hypothetical protein
MALLDESHATINDLLSNSLVLDHLAPYLSIQSRLALKNTSKSLRAISQSPNANIWRYLDLSRVSTPPNWDPRSHGDSTQTNRITEETLRVLGLEFYDQGLRSVLKELKMKGILENATTLILDGLPLTAELVHEVISTPSFNVRILSIREVEHMNERTLIQVLEYAVRDSRPKGTPKLKGLYVFGPRDETIPPTSQALNTSHPTPNGVTNSLGAQIGADWNHRSYNALSNSLAEDTSAWYQESGRILKRRSLSSDWSELIRKSKGIIAFDAVLCPGVAHTHIDSENESLRKKGIESLAAEVSSLSVSQVAVQPTEIASIALGSRGCEKCHSCPEGFAVWGKSTPERFPLLAPPPRHSSTIRAAQTPYHSGSPVPPIILRCESCMRGRWCERCGKWWCEACYQSEIDTRTAMQKVELLESQAQVSDGNLEFKVHMGLCVQSCLVSEMMSGAGSNGMWG